MTCIRVAAFCQLVFMLTWLAAAVATHRRMWRELNAAGWLSYASREGKRSDFRDRNQYAKHREFYPQSNLRNLIAGIFLAAPVELAGMVAFFTHCDKAVR